VPAAAVPWFHTSSGAVAGTILLVAAPAQLGIPALGTGMCAAAQVLAAQERPGDAVIYPGTGIPRWYLAYPDGFARLREIGMAQSGPATGRLDHRSRAGPDGAGTRRPRIWVVEMGPAWQNPAPALAPGFRLARVWQWRDGPVTLKLYQRPGETASGRQANS
jgi:hypothetical protein